MTMRFRIIIILLLEIFGIVTWKRLDRHPMVYLVTTNAFLVQSSQSKR